MGLPVYLAYLEWWRSANNILIILSFEKLFCADAIVTNIVNNILLEIIIFKNISIVFIYSNFHQIFTIMLSHYQFPSKFLPLWYPINNLSVNFILH